ncbi:MAG: MerR family transcriptional regulator [Gemmatimonadales bacterium]|nr:MAG: MerR family transcriptional regulator [Gemmatimonadales bacterium]
MIMRMQELAAQTGLSKTKIHHYLREGLLPPSQKSARNAALYGQIHVDRLNLIAGLRGAAGGKLSIPQIRTVLANVESGMSRASAVRLAVEGIGPVSAGVSGAGWETAEALASEAGVTLGLVRALEAANLIPDHGNSAYSAGDLLVARACDSLCGSLGVEPSDLTPLLDLIREVGDYSDSLARLYSSQAEAASIDPDGVRIAMRDSIRGFLDALLWRALET